MQEANAARESLNLMRIAHQASPSEYTRIFQALDPAKLRDANKPSSEEIVTVDNAAEMGVAFAKKK